MEKAVQKKTASPALERRARRIDRRIGDRRISLNPTYIGPIRRMILDRRFHISDRRKIRLR